MDVFIGPQFYSSFERNPLTLVDVGAGGGLLPLWNKAVRWLRVIAFEPDAREFKNLTLEEHSYPVQYCPTALCDVQSSQTQLYLTSKQELSSMFRPNRSFLDRFPEAERFDIKEQVTVDSDTLDVQLMAMGAPEVDFLKIDAQGGALSVLKGARGTLLNNVFGIELEVELVQMYEKQPLFADVDRFLSDAGFTLFDFRPYYWKRSNGMELGGNKGQLIMADVLYLKKTEKLVGSLKAQDEKTRSKLLRAISICLLYGYFDYALELVDEAGGNITPGDSQALRQCIQKQGRNSWARLIAVRIRCSLRVLLESAHKGWALARGLLGNLD